MRFAGSPDPSRSTGETPGRRLPLPRLRLPCPPHEYRGIVEPRPEADPAAVGQPVDPAVDAGGERGVVDRQREAGPYRPMATPGMTANAAMDPLLTQDLGGMGGDGIEKGRVSC